MEIYWKYSTYGYIILDIMMIGYILYRFVRPFLKQRKGAFLIGAAYPAVMLTLYFEPVPVNNFLAYSLGILTAFLVMCFIDRRNYCQKVFLAITFFSLRWLSSYIIRFLTAALYDWVISSLYLIERPPLQLLSYIGACLCDLALRFCILGSIVKCVVKAYRYKQEKMSGREMLMLTLPSAGGMLEYGIIQYYYQSHLEEQAVETLLFKDVLMFLHYVAVVVVIIVVTILFQNLKARQEEKLLNELLDMQIASIRQHIGQVESWYQNIRSVRHDMTNHILILERLYASGQAEEARAYGEDLRKALDGAAGEMKSGNPVTDVILWEKKEEAEKQGIRFTSEFHYPASKTIHVLDLSILLNNGLQNAVENSGNSSQPYVSVVSYRRNNAYMIEIRNSFAGELQWDEERSLPCTSKENPEGHGFGLANIRRVARKYSGDMDILLEDGEFCLSVLLMLE